MLAKLLCSENVQANCGSAKEGPFLTQISDSYALFKHKEEVSPLQKQPAEPP